MVKEQRESKYNRDNLFRALRLFVEARRNALEVGFTDNGGAIHSIERILDILACRIKYPKLRHINSAKRASDMEISVAAHEARLQGERIRIEHVMPQRAFARQIIDMIERGQTDNEIEAYVGRTYRLVLLTEKEARALDLWNRSSLHEDRIRGFDIKLYEPTVEADIAAID